MADIRPKRDNMNQNMSGPRRPFAPMPGKPEFRFLIPSKVASVLIGKGGERIQRLRQQCNARLSIPDNIGPERIFSVEGTIENCATIWKDCFFEVKELMGNNDPDSDQLDIRLLYHTTLVGNIIGKGGDVIKTLKQKYELDTIKVYPIPTPQSTDRVVQLVGNIDRIFACVGEIVDILSKQVPKGEIVKFDSSNCDEANCSQYGGWGTNPTFGDQFSGNQGPSGDFGMSQNPRFNRPRAPFPNNGPRPRNGGPMPPRMNNSPPFNGQQQNQSWNGPGMPRPRFAHDTRPDNNQQRPSMGFGDQDGPRKRFNPSDVCDTDNKRQRPSFSNLNGTNTTPTKSLSNKSKVLIPREFLQRLTGGDKLQTITRDSGAEIFIDSSNIVPDSALLVISGNNDQIEGAQFLLQICIKKISLNL